jgi:ketosteroid isomerase-like protein
MSEEKVEVVRRHIEAFRRGDEPGALSYFDPYVVWDPSRVRPLDFGVAYGREEVDRTIRHYIGAFEDYDYEAQRLTDLGSGAVLVTLTEGGRGKSSGVPVRQSLAALYTVIDGKIARVTFFASEEQALEAAGLSE